MTISQRTLIGAALSWLAILLSGCGGSAAPAPAATPASSPAASAASSTGNPGSTPASSAQPASSSAKPAAAAPAGGPESIKISYVQPAGGFAPLWIAQDQGLFKKYGLNTEVVHLPPPSDTQALISGDVQFIVAGSAGIGAMANGADVPYIAVTAPVYLQPLYSQPSVATIADLVGKKVAVTTKGGPAELALLTLLKRAGVEPSGVNIVYLRDDATNLAALESGQVQAAIITSPNTLVARQAGLRLLQDLAPLKLPTLTQGLEVRRDWAVQHQAAVQNFLKAYLEGIKDMKTDKALAESTISKWTTVTDQAMLDESYTSTTAGVAAYPLAHDDSIQNVIDLSADPKVKSHPPSYYYDNSYLEKLQDFMHGLYPQGIPSV